MTVLAVHDIAKSYPNGPTITCDMRLDLKRYAITALCGPSGCGKTTVLRCLAGLERPERGTMTFGDEAWHDASRGTYLPPQRRGVGYLAQDYALFPHLNVFANIGYGLRGSREARHQRIAELLQRWRLDGLAARFPRELSGGQQQRVALARALAPGPRLLLLDEPLSALDASTREALRPELRHDLVEAGVPAIMVTHDRAEALALADYVVVMNQGRVCQTGPTAEVFARPAGPEVARIVGVETIWEGTIVRVGAGVATVAVGSALLQAALESPAPFQSGQHVLACVRPEDVVLHIGDSLPTSARNVLPMRVRSLTPHGFVWRVELHGDVPLVAHVTRPAHEELQLECGTAVHAMIKATCVHLIPHVPTRS